MPKINFNCYSFTNIENGDGHSQDIAYYLVVFYLYI